MKLREQKRILFFLERLAENYQEEDKKIHPQLIKHFLKEELIEVVIWLYGKKWNSSEVALKSEAELIDLIGTNLNLLHFIIDKIEENFQSFPTFEQTEVATFFKRTQNEIHYLASKPVKEWDAYDKSNYRSLLLKTGTTKKVFGIFTADVLAEDVYVVTTKPTYFFDTKEEAEAEISNIILAQNFRRDELTIHKLWLIQNK